MAGNKAPAARCREFEPMTAVATHSEPSLTYARLIAARLSLTSTRTILMTATREINETVDRAKQVILGDVSLEAELVEQLRLFDLPLAHHDQLSQQLITSESET